MAEAGQSRNRHTTSDPRAWAAVIIATFLGWMAVSWAGGALGLPVEFALVIDIVCFGVLGWALVMLMGIRRMRRGEGR